MPFDFDDERPAGGSFVYDDEQPPKQAAKSEQRTAGGSFVFDDEQPRAQVRAQAATATSRTWGQALGDTGNQLAEGVNNVIGAVPNLIAPNSRTAEFFRDNSDHWRGQQSEPLKARIAQADVKIDAADDEGMLRQISVAAGEYFSDPALAARFVVTNLPSMIPGVAATKLAQAAALARGASAAKAASVATTAAGGTNAALNGGGARGEAYEDIKRTLEAQGMSPEEAERMAMADSRLVAAVGAVAGFASGKTGLEGSLVGRVGAAGALRAGARVTGVELVGEQIEEVAPKITTNLQASEYDGRTLAQDVGRTMVETAIGSGPGALVAGGLTARNTSRASGPPTPTADPASPGAGAGAAAGATSGPAALPPPSPAPAPSATANPLAATADTAQAEAALLTPSSLTALDRVGELDAESASLSKQLDALNQDGDHAQDPERQNLAAQIVDLEQERAAIAATWPKTTPGARTTFSTEAGVRLEGQYALAEAADLITSHDEGLRANPAFPSELQPRDRTRQASELQVSGIVQRLDPARLGVSADSATGAPIIGKDGLVESGNARTIALKRVYQANGQKAEDYKVFLREQAAQFGLDPAAIDGMSQPVLVRVRNTPVNRAEFARQANQSTIQRMAPAEQALADSKRLTSLDGLDPDDNGDFDNSRDFIRQFMAGLPVTEQSGMVESDGRLSTEGYRRIQSAVLAKAYGDSPTLRRMTESRDNNLVNVSKALVRVAPTIAAARERMDAGTLFDADIAPDLLAAVEGLSALKEKGWSAAQELGQGDLTGPKYSPEAAQLLTFLADNARSPRRIAEFLQRYYEALEQVGNPGQSNMFDDGAPAPSRNDLINQARGSNDGSNDQDTQRGVAGARAQPAAPDRQKPEDAPSAGGRNEGDGPAPTDADGRPEAKPQREGARGEEGADAGVDNAQAERQQAVDPERVAEIEAEIEALTDRQTKLAAEPADGPDLDVRRQDVASALILLQQERAAIGVGANPEGKRKPAISETAPDATAANTTPQVGDTVTWTANGQELTGEVVRAPDQRGAMTVRSTTGVSKGGVFSVPSVKARMAQPAQGGKAAPADSATGGDGAVFSTTGAKPAKGLSVQRVQEVANRVLDHLGVGAVAGLQVVREPGEAGLSVPASVVPQGATGDGKIYLFADNIGNELEAFKVVVHELFHLGLSKSVEQGAYIQTMLGYLSDPAVREYAQRWKASADGVSRKGTMPVNNWQALAVEEALADIAEEMNADRGGTGTRKGWSARMARQLGDLAVRAGLQGVAKQIRAFTRTEAEAFVQDVMQRASSSAPVKLSDTRFASARTGQTESEAFKRWFGASKVVDANGAPMVMYHGTSASVGGDAFTRFDTAASNYGLMGMGGYFTADPAVASSYTTKGKGNAPSVYPVYLSIKTPLDMDAKADPAQWKRQFPNAGAMHEGGATNESWYRAAEDALADEGLPMWEGAEAMQDGLRAMGFDGITHMGGGRVKSDGVKHRVYIAFDDVQVKSATGNSGAFDPQNPDIRFSRRSASGNRVPDVVIGHRLGDLNRHPDYQAAKAGDSLAAARIAIDLVDDAFVQRVRDAAGNAKLIVPVVSVEASGRNKIPAAVADLLAEKLGSDPDAEIVQVNSPKRTAMDGLDRLLSPPVFEGAVQKGATYVLVDDTVTQGGTFAALASHIADNGAEVVGLVALTGKQYSAALSLPPKLLAQVREQFQDVEPQFQAATGYGFDALTASEARYLVKHDDAQRVRDRIVAAGIQAGNERDAGLPPQNSRSQAAVNGEPGARPRKPTTPVAAIRAAINKRYGRLLEKLEAKGLVTLTQTEAQAMAAAAQARADKSGTELAAELDGLKQPKDGPTKPSGLDIKRSANGAIQGFFDPVTGKAFLVADGLTEKTAGPVLIHEVGIHMAQAGKLDALFERAAGLLRIGPNSAFLNRVRARMESAGETSGEEAAAYIAEEFERDSADAPSTVTRWLADLTAAVRAWMFSSDVILKAEQLSVADIAAVARANARSLASDREPIADVLRNVIQQSRALFGRQMGKAPPMSADPGKTPLYEAMRQLARFDASFVLGSSEATDLSEIAQSMQADTDTRKAKFTATEGTAMARGVRKPTLQLTITDARGRENKLLDIFEADSARPYVVIGNGDLGQQVNGSHAYQIAFAWAHNNGKVMRPDPAGLTVINRLRRTEAMVSSAMRFGTTKHLEPHQDQYIALTQKARGAGVEPEDTSYENAALHSELQALKKDLWRPGDGASTISSNVQHLIEASSKLAEIREPGIKTLEVVGGVLRKRGTMANGVPLENLEVGADTGQVKVHDVVVRPAVSGVGGSTIQRAAVAASVSRAVNRSNNSPLRGNSEDRGVGHAGVLALQAIRQTLGQLDGQPPSGLSPLFYSQSGNGDTPPGGEPPGGPPAAPLSAWGQLKARAEGLLSPANIDSFLYEFQDKLIDLKRLRQHIKDIGGTLNDLNDAYLGEELYHKRVAKRAQDFLNDELKPLLEQMRSKGILLTQMEEFLHARHAPEANLEMLARNPTQQMLDTELAAAEAEVRSLEQALQSATAQGSSTVAIQSALEEARGMATQWKNAEAFKGTEAERRSLSGMTDAKAAQVMAALTPETRMALDALAARVDAMNEQTLDLGLLYGLTDQKAVNAQRNAYQFYVPLHRDEAHPDSASHPAGQGFSIKGEIGKRRVGSNEKVTHILGHIAMQREAVLTRGEKNLVGQKLYMMAAQNPDPNWWAVDAAPRTKTVDKKTGFVTTGFDAMYKSRPNVVVMRIGGKDAAVVFNERNENAARLAVSLKTLDASDMHVVLGWVAKGTRWLASVNTQYNPIFGIINFARDTQAALLGLGTTPLRGQEAQVAKNMLPALKAIYADVRSVRWGGKSGDAGGAWGKLWDDMQMAGGTTGYRDLFADPNERAKALEKVMGEMDRGNASKFAHGVVDWLSDYNETMEGATRLAAYKVALDSGMSKPQAASLAKNITVNFNRKGRQTREIGALYAFFNAAVQGTTRMMEVLRGPTGKKVMLGGVLLGAMNALIGIAMMGGDDEDDVNGWEKIPEFVRQRSLVIPLGREDFVAIPLPLGFNVFPNMGRMAVEMMAGIGEGSAGAQLARMLGMLVGTFNPLGAPPTASGVQAVLMLSPTVTDPIVSLLANKDWTDRPIYREDNNSLDPTPGHLRTKDSASTPAKLVSRWLNDLTFGNAYRPGFVSWTPDQLDYVVGVLTGGVGRELIKLNQTVTAPFTGDELPAHKIPLLGRLYGNTRGAAVESGPFSVNVREINEIENEFRGRAVARDEFSKFRKEEPLVKMIGRGNQAERQVQQLRTLKKRATEAGDAERVKEMNERIGVVMKDFNRDVRRAKREANE